MIVLKHREVGRLDVPLMWWAHIYLKRHRWFSSSQLIAQAMLSYSKSALNSYTSPSLEYEWALRPEYIDMTLGEVLRKVAIVLEESEHYELWNVRQLSRIPGVQHN